MLQGSRCETGKSTWCYNGTAISIKLYAVLCFPRSILTHIFQSYSAFPPCIFTVTNFPVSLFQLPCTLSPVSTTRVHGPSSRAELTARVNSGVFFDTRVDGPSWRVSKNAPELTGRQLGCIFDTRQLGPSTLVVETGLKGVPVRPEYALKPRNSEGSKFAQRRK